MSRTRTVNGKRRVIGLKVSDAKYDAVEAARGETPRALWVEAAIDKALAAEGISPAPHAGGPFQPAYTPPKRARKTPAGQAQTRGQRPRIGPPASSPPPPPPPARALRAHPPGAPVFQDPGAEAIVGDAPPAPAATRKRCNHPGTRLIGGHCPSCAHVIEPGGYWRET